jgi:hypothetical protein
VLVRRKGFQLTGVVLGISALVLVLIAGGLFHEHHSAASEAACVICHVGRAPLVHGAPAAIVPTPVAMASVPQLRKAIPHLEAVFL